MTRIDIIKQMAPHFDRELCDLERMATATEGTINLQYNPLRPASLEHFVIGCYIEALENYVRKTSDRGPG